MAAQAQVSELEALHADVETLLPSAPEPQRRPRQRGLRQAAFAVAGALVVVVVVVALGGLGAASSWGRGSPELGQIPPRVGFVGLSDSLPNSPTMKSFIAHSKPYLGGGSNGTLTVGQQGGLLINEDGVWKQYYLPGANIVDGGKTVEYRPPWRFYLMKHPTTDYSNSDNFYKMQWPGKTFTVDMNLNGASCGCNLNFYLVDMPVGFPGSGGDYYCDAQCFPNMGCCAEFDMNEGNANVQQITNHACTHNYNGHPDWQCNKWGDPEDKSRQSQFSIGPGHTIDSRRTFTFSQEFRMEGSQLRVITTMSQEGRSVSFSMGPNEQLQAMLHDGSLERGMAFVTGYWYASDMNWLDGDECGGGSEHCNQNPAYISNWRITSSGSPVPSPAPGPAPGPAPSPGPSPNGQCPGQGYCDCGWADQWCGDDDGSECFCRCCCERKGGSCKWAR